MDGTPWRLTLCRLENQMCGICGATGPSANTRVARMVKLLSHRGPDATGTWSNEHISIGHTRLSIIDLTTGEQPMQYANGALRISFNGEIYNYQSLRQQLQGRGHTFATTSDTEVIAAAFSEWGVRCVDKLIGMFAFAIWDERNKKLFLARDRLGIKPLYYQEHGGTFAFASETKALLTTSTGGFTVDPISVHQVASYRYVRGESTMIKGIKRLPPAHFAEWDTSGLKISRYWSLPQSSESLGNNRQDLSPLMQKVVEDHLVSDVPVGAFVSGGLDSTALAAWAMETGISDMDAFCMEFESIHNESDHAEKASRALGMTFNPVRMEASDFGKLREIAWHLDEPIGDAIAIATFSLAERAARQTKVVLSGEGADEIFAGYIHLRAIRMGDMLNGPLGAAIVAIGRSIAGITPNRLLQAAFPYPGTLGTDGSQLVRRLLTGLRNPTTTYRALTQLFSPEQRRTLYCPDFHDQITEYESAETNKAQAVMTDSSSGLAGAIRLDIEEWLPNYTLHRLDRLLMAHGLEGRVPYADHRIVEFASQLPANALISLTREKLALRSAAPSSIRPWSRRPKQAFTVPLDDPTFAQTGHGVVKQLIYDMIDARRGYFVSDELAGIANKVTGSLLSSKQAVALAMLEAWHQVFIDSPPQQTQS